MKHFLLSILLLGAMTTQAQTVTMPDGSTRPLGDMDGDGEVNISDVTALVNKILGKTPSPVPVLSCPDDHHPHLIDLGLPSGTLWSCCNVGASTPEGYGGYYAWGETQTKDVYNWSTYKWGSDWNKLTKYNTKSGYGSVVDNKTTLESADDAATANWGTPWRMPTDEDFEELLSHTTSTWTAKNGVNGGEFKGDNGGILFLPAAGITNDGVVYEENSYCNYWSSSLNDDFPPYAYCLYFNKSDHHAYRTNGYYRYTWRSVRPVHKN